MPIINNFVNYVSTWATYNSSKIGKNATLKRGICFNDFIMWSLFDLRLCYYPDYLLNIN